MKPNKKDFTFTSESVSEGHPDKVCDRVSDSIVDLFLSQDPQSRTAVECLATTNNLIIAGETRASKSVPSVFITETAREAIKEIGYEQTGFNWRTLEITNLLHAQSPDIAMGVDEGADKEEGAGDQGIMFGYAVKEGGLQTNFMPATIFFAHRILEKLSIARNEQGLTELLPDAKSQVTLQYKNGVPVKAAIIVVSTQHQEYLSQSDVRDIVRPYVMSALPDPSWFPDEDNFLVNPTGRFVIGGPDGDTGMTGRKIIIDNYGGSAPHGGGAFSGKDPTKVDRSAAYMARYMAKNVVASGLADECLIQVSYAIGISHPLSFFIDTNGTGKIDEDKITAALLDMAPLTPKGIRTYLDLNRPIYKVTSSYGHFGRQPTDEGHFPWERTDLAEKLKVLL